MTAEVDLPEFEAGAAAPTPADDGPGVNVTLIALAGGAVVLAGLLVALRARRRAAAPLSPPPPLPPPPPSNE